MSDSSSPAPPEPAERSERSGRDAVTLPPLTAEQRADLLAILGQATDLVPAVDAAVRACAASTDVRLAREMHEYAVIFNGLYDRARVLRLPAPLKTEVLGLLDYHRELVGQAPLAAFGYANARNQRQRALLADGLGGPADQLVELRRALEQQA